ncbi:hypothetical protein HC891_21120 [Candidatus Gracilibacteria bacterium]|nr:hypothetical protein [Candidatus Gracilibacteria bacterium]
MSSRSTPRAAAVRLLFLCASLFLLCVPPLLGSAASTTDRIDDSVVAYVSSSTDNQAIRTITPDGSGDRLLWRIPNSSNPLDGIGSLSWRPDGAELLFDSGHDWQRSMAISDLFAIAPDGSALRRVSSPPGPTGYGAYPTGTVTFVVDALEQGDAQVYMQGAAAAVNYVARSAESYRFTLSVADLGAGVRQYIRVWDPDALDYPCLYSEDAWADVVAGQTVDLGVLYFAPATSDQACWHMFSPSWSHDGSRLLYLFREPTPFALPNNNIWQIAARAPNNLIGERVLDLGEFVNPGRLYRVVFAPTAARGDEMLFLQNEALIDLLWHATTANAAGRRQIDLGACPRLSCELLDVAWLPDGSGFIIARYETRYKSGGPPAGGVLYRYRFADEALTEILRLPNEIIGKLALAPDGSSIVFERGERLVDAVTASTWGPAVQCPCALWQVR